MVAVPALYELAERQQISVLPFSLPENGSVSVQLPDGRTVIGMDRSVLDGGVAERVHLAHELGHCMTGSFYSVHTAVDSRRRHENRADKWSIRRLIKPEKLEEAARQGYREPWELAEYFGVTEALIRKALCLYRYGNVASELYF